MNSWAVALSRRVIRDQYVGYSEESRVACTPFAWIKKIIWLSSTGGTALKAKT